jgi:hypothetical protein
MRQAGRRRRHDRGNACSRIRLIRDSTLAVLLLPILCAMVCPDDLSERPGQLSHRSNGGQIDAYVIGCPRESGPLQHEPPS